MTPSGSLLPIPSNDIVPPVDGLLGENVKNAFGNSSPVEFVEVRKPSWVVTGIVWGGMSTRVTLDKRRIPVPGRSGLKPIVARTLEPLKWGTCPTKVNVTLNLPRVWFALTTSNPCWFCQSGPKVTFFEEVAKRVLS